MVSHIILLERQKGNDSMMKNVSVQYLESGLIIGQNGIADCIVVPELLKSNFYETLLAACLNGGQVSWSDLDGNRLLLHYEFKNKFNCFINGCYCGDLPFIPLSETSIALPIDTNDTEQLNEIFDSELVEVETYLLYESELF